MLKFGEIQSHDSENNRYRVRFPQDGTVSFPLPVASPGITSAAVHVPLNIGDMVACLMDENAVNGVVLGGINTRVNPPVSQATDAVHIVLTDGTVMYVAPSEIGLAAGTTELTLNNKVKLGASNGDTLGGLLFDLISQLEILTVTCTAPGSPSSPPINLAALTAIKARVQNIFD